MTTGLTLWRFWVCFKPSWDCKLEGQPSYVPVGVVLVYLCLASHRLLDRCQLFPLPGFQKCNLIAWKQAGQFEVRMAADEILLAFEIQEAGGQKQEVYFGDSCKEQTSTYTSSSVQVASQYFGVREKGSVDVLNDRVLISG
jgi:hypothetical protein